MSAKHAFASAFIGLACLTLGSNAYSLDAKNPSGLVTLIADSLTPLCADTSLPRTFGDRLLPDGTRVPFAIPAGQVLVITSYDWVIEGSTEAGGTVWTTLVLFNGTTPRQHALTSGAAADSGGRAAGNTVVPNGIVVKPGMEMCFNFVGGAGPVFFARIHGFLADDR